MLRFLRVSVPLLLILAVVLWLLYRSELKVREAMQRAAGESSVQLASQTIKVELGGLRGDLLYLADEVSLHGWLSSGARADRARLGADFLAFLQHHRNYDQVRFIDARGREVVRINTDGGQPVLVPDSALQDKSGRYYVNKTLALRAGQIYMSPFDLNIENGVLVQPIQPVIRLGTPIFDDAGRLRGLVMLSYRGRRILDYLAEIGSRNNTALWLLNADGYWLLGPDTATEWGFMFPERREMRFQRNYAQAWEAILAGPAQGQLKFDQVVFTYSKINPDQTPTWRGGRGWVLVAPMPRASLAADLALYARHLFVAYAVLAALLLFASGVITFKDTQRRRSEARTRESETRFGALLQAAPDAIVILDQSGRIKLINSQAEVGFGYSREELVGRQVEQLVPASFQEQYCGDFAGYLKNPVPRSMGVEAELSMLRKDGTAFPAEIRLSPLHTGQGMLIISIIRDISARQQAEEAQRQLQLRYQELVNNLPIGVYRNTPGEQGSFIEINHAMVDIFEAESVEALLAHSVSDLYCDPLKRREFSERLMRQGSTRAEELQLKTLRGRPFFAAITAVMKRDRQGEVYFDGIVEDVSERKESERSIRQLNGRLYARSVELETINRELEAFSYSVSHDLRAPLRAMDGFSLTLLQDYAGQLDDKGKDRLNRIRAAAQRMALLIDDLLKLSRVSRTEIVWTQVDLSRLAEEVMEELQASEPQRRVSFSVQQGLSAGGDARLLRILLANLLGNAWKFTRRCEEAKIEMGGNSDREGYIYSVRDNGAGFDMTYVDKLFGAFQRLHDNREFPGSGIGLATAQRVVSKHGGRIWAEGEVGRGATFYFTLDKGADL